MDEMLEPRLGVMVGTEHQDTGRTLREHPHAPAHALLQLSIQSVEHLDHGGDVAGLVRSPREGGKRVQVSRREGSRVA